MSRHEGVSCDSCIKGNFRGLRFKCLICYDYDLCAACFEAGATSTRHTADHPMQCILTRSDYETYYGGESISPESPQSYTCPYCGKLGYTEVALYDHVTSDHSETPYEVVCPICASLPGGEPNQVTDDFAVHLTMEHRGGTGGQTGILREEEVAVGRGVRRIPHPARGTSGPRTRRPNMHFSSSGTGMASGANNTSNGSNTASSRDRDRETMDPIAELLSQLSGVRRGLSGVSGASGLGSVLGLGALGSLGGALGSLGASLGNTSSSGGTGLSTSAGRGRLAGVVGRDNSGAFTEIVNNGTNSAQPPPPQLERHQALRLPRRQTQVISTPTTFSSPNITSGVTPTTSGYVTSSVPQTGNTDLGNSAQFLLSRGGHGLKERRDSNSQSWQDRSLFVQDLILSSLAQSFELDLERDFIPINVESIRDSVSSRGCTETDERESSSKKDVCPSSCGAVAMVAESVLLPMEKSEPGGNVITASGTCTQVGSQLKSPTVNNNALSSTRPKQSHHESKGSNNAPPSGRRSLHLQQPTGMRLTSASSSSVNAARSALQGSVVSGSVGPTGRSRNHGTNGASGTTGSNSNSTGTTAMLRKPARPQSSHPPPPPSSH